MSTQPEATGWDTPTIEVRVYRRGELVQRELCESEADVEQVLAAWAEIEDVTCQVDDLSYHHRPGDVLEPEPAALRDEDDPRDVPAGSDYGG
jgi:hypothetical protein